MSEADAQEPIEAATQLTIAPFTLTRDKLPEESGRYICVADNGCCETLDYSNKYQAFNAYDEQPSPVSAIPVVAWAPIPEWQWDIKRAAFVQWQESMYE